MPKNRREIDPDRKRTEIIDCAEKLFREHGYQATTMTALARAVGIAPNAIYWYFPSKDHVLVAVLERCYGAMIETLAADDSLGTGLHDTLRRLLARLREIKSLVGELRSRGSNSEVIMEFRRAYNRRIRLLLADALKRASKSQQERELLGVAIMAVVEGALIYDSPKFPAEEIVEAAVRGLIKLENEA
jgi:AcrR family transcriptional regulator